MSEFAIEVKDLVFEYSDFRALHNVSFSIKKGSITALVGPNGAGKTTLLRCMSALEAPFSGDVIVDGINSHDNPREVHRKIGYLSDFFGLYEKLTVKQSLTYMAWAHKVEEGEVARRVEEISTMLGIENLMEKKSSELSRGQRQRLAIGQAIIHKPEILILDEPASGLDPEARHLLSKMLLKMRDDGVTIIVSSHILSELEDYSSHMIVLSEGRIVDKTSISDFDNNLSFSIKIELIECNDDHYNYIEASQYVSKIDRDGNKIKILFEGEKNRHHEFLKDLMINNIPVCEFNVSDKSFETIYMNSAGDTNVKKS